MTKPRSSALRRRSDSHEMRSTAVLSVRRTHEMLNRTTLDVVGDVPIQEIRNAVNLYNKATEILHDTTLANLDAEAKRLHDRTYGRSRLFEGTPGSLAEPEIGEAKDAEENPEGGVNRVPDEREAG